MPDAPVAPASTIDNAQWDAIWTHALAVAVQARQVAYDTTMQLLSKTGVSREELLQMLADPPPGLMGRIMAGDPSDAKAFLRRIREVMEDEYA